MGKPTGWSCKTWSESHEAQKNTKHFVTPHDDYIDEAQKRCSGGHAAVSIKICRHHVLENMVAHRRWCMMHAINKSGFCGLRRQDSVQHTVWAQKKIRLATSSKTRGTCNAMENRGSTKTQEHDKTRNVTKNDEERTEFALCHARVLCRTFLSSVVYGEQIYLAFLLAGL